MARTLLILGAGLQQIPAYRAARELGCRIVGADPSPIAPALPLADATGVFDLGDLAACLTLARENHIDGVMTLCADYPVRTAAALCEQLGLPGLRPVIAEACIDKSLMRQKLRDGGAPVPQSIHTHKAAEAVKAVRRIGGECIVKPVDSSGGRGVERLSPDASSQRIETAFLRASQFSHSAGALVEEYVDGPEFSVEALTWNGRTEIVAVTDKLTSGAPYYVEVGHSQPTQVSPQQRQLLEQTCRAAIQALGINNSASHTELRLGPEGPRVIEVGARLGGGFITTHLVPLSCGVDLVKATAQVALGEEPDVRPAFSAASAMRFVRPEPGLVHVIEGVEAARALDGVQEVSILAKVGDRIAALRDATGRVGHVIVRGRSAGEAIALAERARDLVQIRTKEVIDAA